MNIKIGDYLIASDERQFIVKAIKVKEAGAKTKDEHIGDEYYQPLGYFTKFNSALRFIPQQVLRSNDDITVIKEKLEQIQADIKVLPNPIKVEVEKVVVKKEKIAEGDKVTISKEEYEELKERNSFLERLEAAGVDNWEGYSYAFEDDEEEDE